jgi:hypothetical protein
MLRRAHERKQLLGRELREESPLGALRKHRAAGCERPSCGCCSASKLWYRGADRARDRREWRRLELDAGT